MTKAKLKLLANIFHVLFSILRTARIAPFAGLSEVDLADNAYGLSYAILATRWQRKARAQAWNSIYEQWQSRLFAHGSINPALHGTLAGTDRVELLTNNARAFGCRDELYLATKTSIAICTMYIQADEAGWRTARAWANCARRGVRVRLVVDQAVMERKAFSNASVYELIRFLRDAGVEVRLFSDSARCYDVCHAKVLIVDGTYLVTGGRNYADHYAEPGWRDFEILLEGPSVIHAQAVFDAIFAETPAAAPNSAPGHLFHLATPMEINSNPVFIYLLESIRAARKTVDIENAYYFNHPLIHASLAEACRRGVRVRLFTNSAASNDLPYMNYRLYAGFPDLIQAGISLYLRQGKGRTLHCKYFVVDNEWVGMGTSNLDFYSPRFCLELGLHVRDAQLGQALTEFFEQGIAEEECIQDTAKIADVLSTERIGKVLDQLIPDIQ